VRRRIERLARRTRGGVAYLIVGAAALVIMFPYAWMVLTSFKPIEQFFTYPLQWLSPVWTAAHYRAVMGDPRFLRALGNSVVVSTVVTLVSLAVSVPAGYALARLRLPAARPVLVGILSSQFVPPMMFFVPFYIYLSRFSLLNTLSGLVLCYLSFTVPVCAWMVASFFRQIPRDFEEAAMVDGAGEAATLLRVILPLSIPGIITAGLFAFIQAWQEYIFALLYTSTPAAQTAPVMLFYFLGEHQIDYARLMAASVLLSLPIIVPFALAQRYFQQGLMAGGIKG
jgi:ABC-type glycerol-3-phosphate transport system permease component